MLPDRLHALKHQCRFARTRCAFINHGAAPYAARMQTARCFLKNLMLGIAAEKEWLAADFSTISLIQPHLFVQRIRWRWFWKVLWVHADEFDRIQDLLSFEKNSPKRSAR